ncbi:hypothetical protein [Silvibacterium sp.]|uniref:hypothetical protein n=1 Tax=Silvibacterium sp. TaxID=1964179 RepID=UPI0039E442E1
MKPLARPAAFALVASFALYATAQSSLPKAVFTAKTIAIINDTKTGEVSDGALDQLNRWGHFKIIDDPETADIVLRFDHKNERDGRNTQKTDDTGKTTDWGYTMTFSSEVHMHAYLKGSDTAFYSTKSSDGKKKGGQACVSSFEDAWLAQR